MSSVRAAYRQKSNMGKYFIVTQAADASGALTLTVAGGGKPETVYYNDHSNGGTVGSELPVDSSLTVTPTTPGAAGTLLRDLGSEIHVYTYGPTYSGANAGITSPYAKLSTWRATVPVVAGAVTGLAEGAPGVAATVLWVKVWSASGLGVGINRV
jgi:hypothetical protein